MQTWAKRGVRAALVTGGVLAVGTTMAAAEGASPAERTSDRPAGSPGAGDHWSAERGERALPALDVDDARASDPVRSHERYRAMVLTGRLDPMHDLLPMIEHDTTQEIPALREQGWLSPRAHRAAELQLAGWVADPATARPAPGPDAPQPGERRHGLRTPSEGFHRSLSWAGAIGDIVSAPQRALDPAAEAATEVLPAVGSDQDNGLLAPAAGESLIEPGLLNPDAVDLTSGSLAPDIRLHTLPRNLLQMALAERPHEVVRPESVPLEVPGERQLAADEPPTLREPMTVGEPTAAGEPRDGQPGLQAPLPALGELNAFGDSHVSGPTLGRLTDAVGQALPALSPEQRGEPVEQRAGGPATVPFSPLRFAREPHRLPVQVIEPDPLQRLVPERDLVAGNPFPQPRAAEAGGMELPVLGVPIPSLSAVQGHTVPVPGLTADHGARSADDTVEFQRI